MKRIISVYRLIIITTVLAGCQKEKIITAPQLTTASVSAITATTAICGGEITSDGGGPITARGVCWSTATRPTIADSKTSDGDGTGQFSSSLVDLTDGTTY